MRKFITVFILLCVSFVAISKTFYITTKNKCVYLDNEVLYDIDMSYKTKFAINISSNFIIHYDSNETKTYLISRVVNSDDGFFFYVADIHKKETNCCIFIPKDYNRQVIFEKAINGMNFYYLYEIGNMETDNN